MSRFRSEQRSDSTAQQVVNWLLGRWWYWATLSILFLYAFPYFRAINSANELPRIYLTLAIADRGALSIDHELKQYRPTADISIYGGKTFSNKAPGLSLLAVPAYLVVKLLYGWQRPTLTELFFWFRLLLAAIPTLIFLWPLKRFLEQFVANQVLVQLLIAAYAFGTAAGVYGTLFISHHLAAISIALSFMLLFAVRHHGAKEGRIVSAGVLAGLAVLIEYQAALLGPVLFAYALCATKKRTAVALRFGSAAAIPLMLLLGYHWLCFGSPIKTGVHYLASPAMQQWADQGLLGLSEFRFDQLMQFAFGPRAGLFYFSPFLLLAFPGLALLIGRKALRVEGVIALVSISLSLIFIASLSFAHGGWTVGPRYITFALFFFFWPAAVAVSRAEKTRGLLIGCSGLIAASIVLIGLARVVFPHYPSPLMHPWFEVTWHLIASDYAPYNLGWLIGLTGLASQLAYLIVLGAMLLSLLLVGTTLRERLAHVTLAVVISGCILSGYNQLYLHSATKESPRAVKTIAWIKKIWEPELRTSP